MWTGAISFGLVTVPVKLYSALDRKSRALPPALRQDRRAHRPEAGRPPVGRGGPLRGHRQGLRDRTRPLRRDRAGRARGARSRRRPRRSRSRSSSSSPRSTPSTTTTPTTSRPGPGGAKPYRLLLEAMRETGKVAIARVVIRSKEQLVAIRPIGDVLGMATMIFADEVPPPDEPRRDRRGRARSRPPSASSTSPSSWSTRSPATSNPRSTTTPTARRCSP